MTYFLRPSKGETNPRESTALKGKVMLLHVFSYYRLFSGHLHPLMKNSPSKKLSEMSGFSDAWQTPSWVCFFGDVCFYLWPTMPTTRTFLVNNVLGDFFGVSFQKADATGFSGSGFAHGVAKRAPDERYFVEWYFFWDVQFHECFCRPTMVESPLGSWLASIYGLLRLWFQNGCRSFPEHSFCVWNSEERYPARWTGWMKEKDKTRLKPQLRPLVSLVPQWLAWLALLLFFG